MQCANIGVKCVTFVSEIFTRYGSNITNLWEEIFTPVTLAFFCEVAHEKLWKSVNICKSYSKKISGTFFSVHGVENKWPWQRTGMIVTVAASRFKQVLFLVSLRGRQCLPVVPHAGGYRPTQRRSYWLFKLLNHILWVDRCNNLTSYITYAVSK